MSEQEITKNLVLQEGKKALAVRKEGKLSSFDKVNFSKLRCYHENCNKEPFYTIGALLPSVWFLEQEKPYLLPVIYVSCPEHKYEVIDYLPRKTLATIIGDVSQESHKLLAKILKESSEKKDVDSFILYIN